MALKKGWNYFKNHPLDFMLGLPDESEREPLPKKDTKYLLKHTECVQLHRDFFIGLCDDKKYTAQYDQPHIQSFLFNLSESIEVLIIAERACKDFVIRHLCSSPKNLQKVIILDDISKQDEQWIRHRAPSDAEITFPVTYLSKLLKYSTQSNLVFDQITFKSLLVPFKDLASLQSIKYLHIRGNCENDHLIFNMIERFIRFIIGFPNLESIEAHFTLQTQSSDSAHHPRYNDSYDGFALYETMKRTKGYMFQGLPQKVHGKIHFGANIYSFHDMCSSMKYDLNQSSKSLKPPIEYNEADSIIQRKFQPHHGLQIEFSITPASYS